MTDDATLREELCEIGRRVYARGFVAAHDGNLSCRLADGTVLCTPTQISKGFMTPDDLCVVDLDGHQLAGRRKITSEIRLHLEIYRGDPQAAAVVHCHPPHATAWGLTRLDIPTGILPEVEYLLGVVPRAEFAIPGTAAFAATIRPHLGKTNTVLLSSHGTVSWGPTLERAWWLTEILDAYCRMLILARLAGPIERLPADKVEELRALRARDQVGPVAPPADGADAYTRSTFARAQDAGAALPLEALADMVTERVVAALRDRLK